MWNLWSEHLRERRFSEEGIMMMKYVKLRFSKPFDLCLAVRKYEAMRFACSKIENCSPHGTRFECDKK